MEDNELQLKKASGNSSIFNRLTAAAILMAIPAVSLMGCGNGSSTTAAVVSRSAITGLVSAPQSLTRAAHKITRAGADPIVPVPGANVSLIDLDTPDPTGHNTSGKPVANTTTDGQGSYSFSGVTPGKNYKIEATKSVTGGTLTLSAIVSPPLVVPGSTAPPPRNLDPDTTVAAAYAEDLHKSLKSVDADGASSNLQDIAAELEKKRKAENAPPPDLTDPASVTAAVVTLKAEVAPIGSYSGTASSTDGSASKTMQLAALIGANGKFFMIALNPDQGNKNGSGNNGNGGTGTGTGSGSNDNSGNGNNGNGNDNPGTGSGTSPGTGTGNGAPTGGSGGSGNGGGNGNGDNDNFAVGTIDTNGVVNATTKNGNVIIQGLFTGSVGVGTWKRSDGKEKGIWSLNKQTSTFGGLYAGKYTGADSNNGDFALLVNDDGTVWISSGGNQTGNTGAAGKGSIDSAGIVAFTLSSGDGSSVTGSGHITAQANVVEGTWHDSQGNSGTFRGSRAQPDTSIQN